MAFYKQQKGAVTLIGALFIIIVISLMAITVNRMAGSNIVDTSASTDAVEGLFVAESGIEFASFAYANSASATPCDDLVLINSTNAGRGSFDITSAKLEGTDCRITVTARVSSAGMGAPDAALRTVSADLRLPTPATAWAVGKNGNLFLWDGSTWTKAKGASSGAKLKSIRCVTPNECWAVGKKGVVWHYNGSTWTESVLDNTEDYESVDCAPNNPAFCFLVGKKKNADGIIRFWNGGKWSDPTPTTDDLKAVACPSTTCYAVGKKKQPPLRFNGTSWVAESNNVGTELKGLHCYAPDSCWAAGEAQGGNYRFAFRSGSGSPVWQESTAASPYKEPDLESVYCVSANDCRAVGDRVDTSGGGPKKQYNIVHWDGTAWTARSLGAGEDLKEVTCSSASNCLAVGKKGTVLHWNGLTWSDASKGIGGKDLESVTFGGTGGSSGAVQVVRWTEVVVN